MHRLVSLEAGTGREFGEQNISGEKARLNGGEAAQPWKPKKTFGQKLIGALGHIQPSVLGRNGWIFIFASISFCVVVEGGVGKACVGGRA